MEEALKPSNKEINARGLTVDSREGTILTSKDSNKTIPCPKSHATIKIPHEKHRNTSIIKKNIRPKPTEKPLTPKERIAVAGLASGMSKKDSLLSAGYSENTANKHPESVYGKTRVVQAIAELMDEMGLTDRRLLETLKDGLEANKVISANVIMPSGEGMKDAGSMTKDFIEVPDHDARHKFMTTGLKLRGHLKDKVDVAMTVETYEQKRKRLGLDHLSPDEAMERLLDRIADRIATQRLAAEKEK